MERKTKLALLTGMGIGLLISSDYFLAIVGPARVVAVESKIEAPRDLLPGDDDLPVPSFIKNLMPVSKQVICREVTLGKESGKIPVSDYIWNFVEPRDRLLLRYNLGRFSGLVYNIHFDAKSVRILSDKKKLSESSPQSTATSSPAPTPFTASTASPSEKSPQAAPARDLGVLSAKWKKVYRQADQVDFNVKSAPNQRVDAAADRLASALSTLFPGWRVGQPLPPRESGRWRQNPEAVDTAAEALTILFAEAPRIERPGDAITRSLGHLFGGTLGQH